MLRVKGELDACRLKPVPCDGHVDNDALRFGVGRAGLISKAWASPCLRRDRASVSWRRFRSDHAAQSEFDGK